MMAFEIKFVYFDIGGVVVLDFSQTLKFRDYFLELGMTDEQHFVARRLFTEHAEDICDGTMSIFQLQDKIAAESGFVFSVDLNLTKEFTDRFELNPGMQQLINTVQEKYKVGLLTNMYDDMLDMIKACGIFPDIVWDTVVDSSVVQVAKPHESIYELAEQQSGVRPEEILFVDNLQENLDVATARGWQTCLYDPSETEESNNKILNLTLLNKNA